MKKFLLSFFCCLVAFVSVKAEEYTYIFESKQFTENGKKELNGVSWTLTGNAKPSNYTSTKGQQFGTSSAPYSSMTLSTSDIEGTITKIVINTSGANKINAQLNVSVGNTDFGQTVNLSSTATDYTFNGNASGEIKFTYTQSSSVAIYIKSITITYTTNEGGEGGDIIDPTPDPTPDPEEPVTPSVQNVTFTASNMYTANTKLKDSLIVFDTNITAKFSGSGTASQYYTNGTAVRWYAGNTLTIASTAGNISKIVLTFGSDDGSNNITANVGTYADGTWTGIAKNVTLTVDGASGQRRISAITVTYSTDASEPEVENVNAPMIATDAKEFATGKEVEVTITTATDGATIYYTLDGTDPTTESNVYSGPITISADEPSDVIVKAFAVKEGANNSSIAEKTFTFKNIITLENVSVAEAIAAYKSGDIISDGATVIGYIVGTKNDGLTSEALVKTNLLLADNPDEENIELCLPVELPDKGDIRNALNLVENKGNYKKKVVLTGNIETYFEGAGLKSTSAYEFIEVEETWSSFYSPMAVAIPENIEAYIVTAANNGYVILEQIFKAIPANTAVILKGGKITGNTPYNGEVAEVTGNLLQGSIANTYINEEAYVLANGDYGIGFYKAEMNQLEGTAWLNNAGKAYLPVSNLPEEVQGVANFSFRNRTDVDDGTTAIENVEIRNEKEEIYDLSGRRIEKITKAGIYIINGNKILVK